MTPVRIKVRCIESSEVLGWGEHRTLFRVKFGVVTSGSEENQQFFAATPSGSAEFQTLVTMPFRVNEEYYLDFSSA
jgi:hypothetical protein